MTQGTRLAARPTAYKGIQMRSRLEARYAAWLDRCGFEWEYEPQCFASDDGQYLPDFRLTARFAGHATNVYVEVKPARDSITLDEVARMERIICASEPTALLVLEVAAVPMPMLMLAEHLRPASWVITPAGNGLSVAFLTEWREAV